MDLLLWRLGMGHWGREEWRCGGSCTFSLRNPLPSIEVKLPGMLCFHPNKSCTRFPGRQCQLLGKLGKGGVRDTPRTEDRTSIGQDFTHFQSLLKNIWGSQVPTHVASSPPPLSPDPPGQPSPRITPPFWYTSAPAHTQPLLPMSLKTLLMYLPSSPNIPKLNQE